MITKILYQPDLLYQYVIKKIEWQVGSNELAAILQQLYENNNGDMIQELQLYGEAYGVLL